MLLLPCLFGFAMRVEAYSAVDPVPAASPAPCPMTQSDCKGDAKLNVTSCKCELPDPPCKLSQDNCTNGGTFDATKCACDCPFPWNEGNMDIVGANVCKVCTLSPTTASCGRFNATFDMTSCGCTGCPIEHEIAPGDTFVKVAAQYAIPMDMMKAANPAFWQIPRMLRPKTFLCIPPLKIEGAIDKATEGVTECYHYTNAIDYRGMRSETVGGATCQNWATQAPHKHDFALGDPTTGLGDHNYCRNPDKKKTAWCYTQSKFKEWDFCDVETPDINCAKGSMSPCMPGQNHCPTNSYCEPTGPSTYQCQCDKGFDMCPSDKSGIAKCWPTNLCNASYVDLTGCDPRATCTKISACKVDCTCEWPLADAGLPQKGGLCVPDGSKGVPTVEAKATTVDVPLGGAMFQGRNTGQ